MLTCSLGLHAQVTVRGKVVDKVNGEPIQYAVIRQQKGLAAVTTDKEGYFQISLGETKDSLMISMIGYRSQTLAFQTWNHPWMISMEPGPVELQMVTITPESNNASFHTISEIDLHIRPINSSQDLLRLVPGLFLGQHHGGGIAEHIFLRGFDADHGTDVNVSVDEMPLNLVSHAHGQGFSDLHFLIPELVSRYEFGKGPYYAEHGDLQQPDMWDSIRPMSWIKARSKWKRDNLNLHGFSPWLTC